MNSPKQSAVKLGKDTNIKGSRVFSLAIACGLWVANFYYNQALLADMEGSLNTSKLSQLVSVLSYQQLTPPLVHLVRQQPVLEEAALHITLIFAVLNAFWASLVLMLESPADYDNSQVADLFGLYHVRLI